ncbi:MAG TPA: Kdo hydroxylase family protein [Terriglobia bacterium]|nr:Kdo hydroxylase family protein [Terriglobia bacterium]
MALLTVTDAGREVDLEFYRRLEAGDILFFPQTPTQFAGVDSEFLLSQRQSGSAYHKNIAYRPATDVLTGAEGGDRERLRSLVRSFSRQTVELLRRLLPRYAANWRVDFTSFRPFEEAGRQLSLHARNDLLHVDAFPTRPTHGDRILRFFTNLHPRQPRVWITTEPFDVLAGQWLGGAGVVELARRAGSPARRGLALLAGAVGLRQFGASPYDCVMHRFHNFLKENRNFQESCRKDRWEFPPRSSWMVFTDSVSHAVLSGQFALEQTFIVSRAAMVTPQYAPVNVLEQLTGMKLTWARATPGTPAKMS